VDRSDVDVEQAVQATGPRTPEIARSRLLLGVVAGAGIVVAGVIALTVHSWAVFAGLLVLHALASTGVILLALRAATEEEKPAPATVARLESQGVQDPEAALNDLVKQTHVRRSA